MAAPITHIVLAEKVFKKYFPNSSREKFLIGTSFPDIRYLKVIERNKTHSPDCSMEKIRQSDDFRAGLLLHSLVDIKREAYMQEAGIYSIIPQSKFITQSLKLYEDELLYSELKNWSSIADIFDNVLQEELDFNINKEDVIKWHNYLKDYFLQGPDEDTRKKFIQGLDFTAEDVKEIESNIEYMRNKKEVAERVIDFYSNFEAWNH